MIAFNELRITPDSKNLIIDASVEDYEYYKDITIDSIIIDTQETYSVSGPSSTPILTYSIDSTQDNSLYTVHKSLDNKNIRLQLTNKDLQDKLSTSLLFVYVVVRGIPSPATPCGMDNMITLGTVVDLFPIYCKTISYLKELNNSCNIPKNLIDMILRLKALELSLKTGNYIQAIEYWNKYFINISTNINTSSCGCNT